VTLVESEQSEARNASGTIPEANGLKATIGGVGHNSLLLTFPIHHLVSQAGNETQVLEM